MGDIFVSYSGQDRERIMPLVRALQETGWSVFWNGTIRDLDTSDRSIQSEIDDCRCMVVVWSKDSIRSSQVISQAYQGFLRHRLVAVAVDDVSPPYAFDSIEVVRCDWSAKGQSKALNEVIAEISVIIGSSPAVRPAAKLSSCMTGESVKGQPKPQVASPWRHRFAEVIKKRTAKFRRSAGTKPMRTTSSGEPTTAQSFFERDNEAPDWRRRVAEELERLPLGQVLFDAPAVMRVGARDRIRVRIAQDLLPDIRQDLKDRGILQIDKIKVGTFMTVRLSGCDFEITPLSEYEQIVSSDTHTEWAWSVLPLKSGRKILYLHVTVRIKINGEEEKRDHPVMDKEVTVQVNRAYIIKQFLVSHWKWIVATLITIVGLLLAFLSNK